MFICPKCKSRMTLPVCVRCGNRILRRNNVWQLTDMPDLVTEGEGDKYIGYEHIGENYSGRRSYLIEERDAVIAGEVSALNGDGVFLDLACGDGCLTVPCAGNGSRIIAGDISNAMLGILQDKAGHNGISLDRVMLCRMNALEIPIEDESVDTVAANSVLHLISNSRKVIDEIYRVLRKGGSFVCLDDRPGRVPESTFDNKLYNEIVQSLYDGYWRKMQVLGIAPKKYGWRFDRGGYCGELFGGKSERLIERGNRYEMRLGDGFLPRFRGRGFSDQTDVPVEIHEKVMEELTAEFSGRYGESFENAVFRGIEDDILITIYRK